MHLSNIINYIPVFMAAMIILNSIMVGIYAMMTKLIEQAKIYPSNVYIQGISKLAQAIMSVLDIVGYHPKRIEKKDDI